MAEASSVLPDKATITNLDKPDDPPIKVMFNPKECVFNKSNSWVPGGNTGANMPDLDFQSGQPATLDMELYFDTYQHGKDVRKEYTDRLYALTMVQPPDASHRKSGKAQPPRVRFLWGPQKSPTWSFDAVITSLRQRFTLFKADGTPVRAVVNVTFQQIKDAQLHPRQNPSSGGTGGERTWTVSDGDTLAWIAYKCYGDCGMWRVIATANQLTTLRRLAPGTVLAIPNV